MLWSNAVKLPCKTSIATENHANVVSRVFLNSDFTDFSSCIVFVILLRNFVLLVAQKLAGNFNQAKKNNKCFSKSIRLLCMRREHTGSCRHGIASCTVSSISMRFCNASAVAIWLLKKDGKIMHYVRMHNDHSYILSKGNCGQHLPLELALHRKSWHVAHIYHCCLSAASSHITVMCSANCSQLYECNSVRMQPALESVLFPLWRKRKDSICGPVCHWPSSTHAVKDIMTCCPVISFTGQKNIYARNARQSKRASLSPNVKSQTLPIVLTFHCTNTLADRVKAYQWNESCTSILQHQSSCFQNMPMSHP